MIVRFLDGFDVSAADNMLKYPGTLVTFLQASRLPGRPGPASSGPNGSSTYLFNTAFGQANFTRTIGAQQVIGAHMDFRFFDTNPGTGVPDVEWYRIGTAGRTLLALRQRPDHRMDIRTYDIHGNAVLLDTTTYMFPPRDWVNLELLGTFGASGNWKLRIDDGTIISQGNANFGLVFPDRATFRFEHFGSPGLNLDNYVLLDGSDGHVEFLGPARITTLSPITDLPGSSSWQRNAAGFGFEALQDFNGADGDLTYLAPIAAGAIATYNVRRSPCFGLNLAVAANMVARPLAGSPSLDALVRERVTGNLITPQAVLIYPGSSLSLNPQLRDYACYQAISFHSFETGQAWTDSQISNSGWGIGADAFLPNVRLSQFFLEKLTTLSLRPFNCGGVSSYSF